MTQGSSVPEPPCRLVLGDCRSVLPGMDADSFDAVVTDPPYELGFMGREWDRSGVAFDPATWRVVLRVLKPSGWMLAMGGSRTYHRLACAVEDAGFEVRDCLMWLYGTGFPKGAGCLKPAYEPILLARRPGPMVLPLGIDGCRVPTSDDTGRTRNTALGRMNDDSWQPKRQESESHPGDRWPANVLHDGSGEVLDAFAAFGERKLGGSPQSDHNQDESSSSVYGWASSGGLFKSGGHFNDSGTAARFFYCAKATKAERGEGNAHPTVKPLALIRWMVRLACPLGGIILDPFAGSGTTGVAAKQEGRRSVLVEREAAYAGIIQGRLEAERTLFDAAAVETETGEG